MKTFRSRWIRYGSAALYILLSFLSFYCACYKLPVGLKYGINLVVFAWACAAFFVSPQFEHALFCLRFFVLFFFPYLMFWMWSAGIWITEFQSWPYILRGSQNIIYMLTNLLYVIGAVYLFDEDATTYTLISMAFANFAVFVQVGLRTGFPRLISEYITLLLTSADDTGGAVRQMELHDMVYGWGTYVTEVEGISRTYAEQNATTHNDALRALQHDVDAISDQLDRHRDDLKYDEEQLKRANEWRAEAELDYELFKDEAEELKEKYGESSPEYRNHLFNDIYTDEMKRAQSSVKSTEESIQYRKEKIAELEKALNYKIPCSGVISRPAASTSCRSFFITSAGIHLRSTLTVRTRLRLRTMSIGA